MNNDKIINEIKKNIYLEKGILNDLEKINKYEKNSIDYEKLKSKIINVDEYN